MKQKIRREPKKDILDVATMLFFNHGFRVGVDRIIAEAGVAKMTFYKYFPAKVELMSAVIQRVHSRIDLRLRRISNETGRTTEERLERMLGFLNQSMTDSDYLGGLIPQALIEIHDPKSIAWKTALGCAESIRNSIEAVCLDAPKARQLQILVLGSFVLRSVKGPDKVKQVLKAATAGALLG